MSVMLLELEPWHCRFPLWLEDETNAGWPHCGEFAVQRSYCAVHALLSFREPSDIEFREPSEIEEIVE